LSLVSEAHQIVVAFIPGVRGRRPAGLAATARESLAIFREQGVLSSHHPRVSGASGPRPLGAGLAL